MDTVLARWGNSLGVRIPKGMAADAGLDAGDTVSITQSAEGIVIKKSQPKPKYCLADLVSRIEAVKHPFDDSQVAQQCLDLHFSTYHGERP